MDKPEGAELRDDLGEGWPVSRLLRPAALHQGAVCIQRPAQGGKNIAPGPDLKLSTLQDVLIIDGSSPRRARAPQLRAPASRHRNAWWSSERTCGLPPGVPAWPAQRHPEGAASSRAPPQRTPGPPSDWRRASAQASYVLGDNTSNIPPERHASRSTSKGVFGGS